MIGIDGSAHVPYAHRHTGLMSMRVTDHERL
jgi:hypothetical protein